MKVGFRFALIAAFSSLVFSSCLKPEADPIFAAQEQWKMDTTAIGSFLRTNNIDASIDASGVRFVIDSLAEGFPPRFTSTVKIKYVGRFIGGNIFDQGTISGPVSNFIDGFQIGLMLLPEKTKARIYIPSGLAYGTNGSGSIPPNTNIMFELQILEVVKGALELQKLASDTIAIDQYLASKSIDAIRDKSGLRYVITQMGTGDKPDLYSKIKIKYSGKLLSDGIEFYNNTNEPTANFDSRVINYIYAMQVALPKLPVGSKATLYIPSGLAFGDQAVNTGTSTVPANANLIYEVELLGIVN